MNHLPLFASIKSKYHAIVARVSNYLPIYWWPIQHTGKKHSDNQAQNELITIYQRNTDTTVKGYIDCLTRYTLDGWLVKDKDILRKIKVYLDGQEVGVHCLPITRKDVKNAIGYGLLSGFSISFFKPLNLTGEVQTLTIRENDSAVDLLTITCSYNFLLPQVTAQGCVSNIVDIIVPIYLGATETLNCLNSIVNAKTNVQYRLILINDCSPNELINKELQLFVVKHKQALLFENPKNLGFVKTVNKGMRLSEANDVVLLNSDTEVSDFWIDKLHRTLKNNPDVGTVTPFSNQATIFSFPAMNPTCDLPEITSISLFNKLLEKHNAACIHDVPTAHGFCMLIRRSTLQEIGLFDEEKWGKGYCEENDFSIRARLKGWRNVIACDTYVKHVGSVSFQQESTSRISKNLVLLNKLYPFYSGQVAEFIIADPLSCYRLPLLAELLTKKVTSKKHIILHVIHSLGGGTEHAMRTLIDRTKSNIASAIVLRSLNKGRVWRLECEDQTIMLDFIVTQGIDNVTFLLKKLGISHIHYHQVLEYDMNVRSLPQILSCQYDLSLHDYYMLCPTINLLNASTQLCDGPEVSKCYSCIKKSGSYSNEHLNSEKNIDRFLKENCRFVKGARKNFAPTLGVKTIFSSYIGTTNIVVKAHPEKRINRKFIRPSKSPIVNVAILGAIGENKGSHLLTKLIFFADKHELPLRFVLIGYGTQELEAIDSDRFVFSGKYDTNELPELITKFDCDRALFISPWPETYSYTLSEALQLGLYPFALSLGAFKDRLEEYDLGTLFPLEYDEKDICQALQTIPTSENEYKIGMDYNSIITDYYDINH